MEHPVDKAARIVGSQRALAVALGVTKGAVWQWKDDGRQVPAEHCPAIERMTAGAVTADELHWASLWTRVPDSTWPHPLGRPLLDFAKTASAAPEVAHG